MMPEKIIEADTLTVDSGRVRLSVRMPWYRSLPLSSVADVVWSVDGQPVTPESITWTVNGHTYPLADLPPRYDEWWYVLDSAVLEGEAPALGESPEHEVEVVLSLYIPYITTDFGVLKISETDRKTMRSGVAK